MKIKKIRGANRFPQRTAIASAVMLAFVTPAALAQYKPNVEVYVKPGSERNYLGVDGLVPLVDNGTALFFADAKAHMVTESSANEVNLGLGYRALTEDQQWAWGVYGAFDYKNTKNDNHFNQLTIGAEVRSREWDFRSNYYQILTDKKLIGMGATNHFAGFGVWRNGVYEEGLSGVDVEVGRLLDISDRYDVRAYLAGYSFKSKEFGAHDDGVRARLEVRPQKNFSLGISLQHDSLFGSTGFVEMRYAFGQSSENGQRTLSERMTDPWRRDQDIITTGAVESEKSSDSVKTSDNAVHINSSYTGDTQDGSYEHPYKYVSGCEGEKCWDELPSGAGRYNLIRLWQGNSLTTSYTRMILLDGQTLWGQGVDIYSGRTQPDLYPVIDSSSSSYGGPTMLTLGTSVPMSPVAGVTLASNGSIGNTVTGVKIIGNGMGIVGYNTGGKVTIDRNIIDVQDTGINLYNYAYGGNIDQTVTISGNTISAKYGVTATNRADTGRRVSQSMAISNNTISAFGGIFLRNTAYGGDINQAVTVSGNTIDSLYGVGVTNQIDVGGGRISQTTAISDNTITTYAGAVDLRNVSAYGGTIDQTVTISGNTVTSRYKYGVSLNNTANDGIATQHATISGNTITASAGYGGLELVNRAAYGGEADQTVTVSGNKLSSLSASSIYAENASSYGANAVQTLTISGNTLTSESNVPSGPMPVKPIRSATGIVLINDGNQDDSTAGAIQNVNISGNTVTGFYRGLSVYSNGAAPRTSQTVTVSGLTVREGESGIVYCNRGTSSQTVIGDSGNTLNGMHTIPVEESKCGIKR